MTSTHIPHSDSQGQTADDAPQIRPVSAADLLGLEPVWLPVEVENPGEWQDTTIKECVPTERWQRTATMSYEIFAKRGVNTFGACPETLWSAVKPGFEAAMGLRAPIQPWSESEEHHLASLGRQGFPAIALAELFPRSPSAIKSKLQKFGMTIGASGRAQPVQRRQTPRAGRGHRFILEEMDRLVRGSLGNYR